MIPDLVLLGAGTILGVGSMLPVGIVLWRGWKRSLAAHAVTRCELASANDAVRIAQRRCAKLANERNAATTHLTDALATIRENEPFVVIGRARKAAIDRASAKKRDGRAK